jgi:hypothetical protein
MSKFLTEPSAKPTQSFRYFFSTTHTDAVAGWKTFTVPFPVSFFDSNYTLVLELQIDTANMAIWQANHAYTTSDQAIYIGNGQVAYVTVGGTSGGTVPTWPTSGTITDGSLSPLTAVTWQTYGFSTAVWTGGIVSKSSTGFVEQISTLIYAPMILNVTATHD